MVCGSDFQAAPPVVVLCVGNALRGDDGFGPAVAARLAGRRDVIDGGNAPENELPRVAALSPRTVILVDAVHFGGPPGELRVAAPEDLAFADLSTHAAPLALCASFLSEACGARTLVLAAQPAGVELGAAMSPEMAAAVDEAAAVLRDVLAANPKAND